MKCKCGNTIPRKRSELGYTLCLECGAKEAEKERIRKARCTAPLYNKGAHQYVATKQVAKDIGRK